MSQIHPEIAGKLKRAEMLPITFNQAALYVIAFWLVLLFHRLSEYFFASLESLTPTFHFYGIATSQTGWSAGAVIAIYLFGPLFLAFIGFYLIQRWQKLFINGKMSIAFTLWLSIHALSRLLTGGISGIITQRELSYVFMYTGIPIILGILIALVLFGIFLILSRKFALPTLLAAHDQRLIDEMPFRRWQVRYFLFFPWVIGASFVSIIHLVFFNLQEVITQLLIGLTLMTTFFHLRNDKPEYNIPIPIAFQPKIKKPLLLIGLILSVLMLLIGY